MNQESGHPINRAIDIKSGPTGPGIVVLLLEGTSQVDIVDALKTAGNGDVQVIVRPRTLKASDIQWREMPRAILLEANLNDADELALIGELKGRDVSVITLVRRGSEIDALHAIHAGTDDVLLMPVDPKEAEEVFTRLGRRSTKHEGAGDGKLIAVMHASGGSGATTIAVNSACALARDTNKPRVGLLDFDIQFGDAADHLDLPMFSRIEDILDDSGRLDAAMLEAMMIRHSSGIRVLTGPRIPLPLTALTSKTVSDIVRVAKSCFNYTVVDLPAVLEPWTDAVLRASDVIYVVCPPTVPAVHRLSKLLDLLKEERLYDMPLRLVINRHQSLWNGTTLTPGQIAKAIDRDIDHFIPNDYKLIASSQNQGRAAVQIKPDSRFAKAINDMLSADFKRKMPAKTHWLSLLGGH